MTREEAIAILEVSKHMATSGRLYNQALDMAIEALSEQNMIPIKLEKRYPKSRVEDITDAFMRGYLKGEANRPKGEWTNKGGEPIKDKFSVYCSKCKEWSEYRTDFCPNCGAEMMTKESEE